MPTEYWLTFSQACTGKSVVRLTDSLDMTIAVDRTLNNKPNKQVKMKTSHKQQILVGLIGIRNLLWTPAMSRIYLLNRQVLKHERIPWRLFYSCTSDQGFCCFDLYEKNISCLIYT